MDKTNRCVSCGIEIPEGDHICSTCKEPQKEAKNCFGAIERGCGILSCKCQGRKCPFFKTKEQYQKDFEAAEAYNKKRGILTPKEKQELEKAGAI